MRQFRGLAAIILCVMMITILLTDSDKRRSRIADWVVNTSTVVKWLADVATDWATDWATDGGHREPDSPAAHDETTRLGPRRTEPAQPILTTQATGTTLNQEYLPC